MGTMPAQRIILLRHAEKPSDDAVINGVDAQGRPDANELSVRGWQRAGALLGLFAPGGSLGVPGSLFAERPTDAHPSRRCVSTLQPLADRLGLSLDVRFKRGEEAELAEALMQCQGTVLAAWDHRHLVEIARALPGAPGVEDWPEQCFDRLWIFSRDGAGWRFEDRPQDLLAGDTPK